MPPPTPDDIVGLDMMIRGQVVVPGSVLFEGEAKKQHSAIFHSNKPALYVLCKDITDVQEALRRGRMTPIGAAPTVRAGGLILHGGVGWLTHRFGTSVDNVMALTIVLADGTVKNLDIPRRGTKKSCSAQRVGQEV
mmetsp:Transcript_23559/g.43538  ORF Transcript_23559/g.43538 Transcript_23559/m.43538 type:complete len:136 (+) Transcript_23559:109-516(+)